MCLLWVIFMDTHESLNGPSTILLADDDPLTRSLLCQTLENEGYRVIATRDGEECLKLFPDANPDLVILDAMMPIMTGMECCSQIKKLYSHLETPILLSTGLQDQASIDWIFQAGATDYISKPINWTVLRHRVRLLIEVSKMQKRLQIVNKKLSDLAHMDSLTSLANRRRFDEFLTYEWKRSIREHTPLSLILCDIDHFKAYNDTYGHLGGDCCLQKVAQILLQNVRRSTDLAARYGGEEFAIVLPNTDTKGALHIAQNIHNQINELSIPHSGMREGNHVTLSQGIACHYPSKDSSIEGLIREADQALYMAKAEGRNTYISYDLSVVQNSA